MSKIEQQMIKAIKNNQDWQSANTSVHFDVETSIAVVRLHGNKIAEVGDDYITLFDGGYQTKTTKSRLNAILSEFGHTCGKKKEFIYQHKFEWFIKAWDEKSAAIVVQNFKSGMKLAE